jgi:hypothetical protein
VLKSTGNTDAATDEAGNAFVVAEIEHAVDHEAQRLGRATTSWEDIRLNRGAGRVLSAT